MKNTVPFQTAAFLTSALAPKKWPILSDTQGNLLPEIAVAGRSNVGKSSLLSHLLKNKNLAKASKTAGKTQRLNFFLIDNQLVFVDLPGYGHAKAAYLSQKQWKHYIDLYFNQRKTLMGILFLLDIRHLPTKEDLVFLTWTIYKKLPLILVFTKIDKVKKEESLHNTKQALTLLALQKFPAQFSIVHYSIKQAKCRKILAKEINQMK